VPLETAHIGQHRLLSFVPVNRCRVVAVATEIQTLVRPTPPHRSFLYLYISLVLSDKEVRGFEILGGEYSEAITPFYMTDYSEYLS